MVEPRSLTTRVLAARAQVALDRKTGRESEAWVLRLAETDPAAAAVQRRPEVPIAPNQRPPAQRMTTKERLVLRLTRMGLTDGEIALRLAISHAAVSQHRRRLYMRFDVNTLRELLELDLGEDESEDDVGDGGVSPHSSNRPEQL